MTFEQALESERTADRMISYFPSHLYEVVLKTIQGNKLNLDQLVQHIYILLQNKSKAKKFISSYRVTFCKDVIRQFVRDNTYKKVSVPGSSYIVKTEIAELYNLKLLERYVPKRVRVKARSNDTPEQLAQRRDNERVNKTSFSFNISNLLLVLNQFHKCTRKGDTSSTLKIGDEFHDDPDFPNLKIECGNCDLSHTLTGVKRLGSSEYPKPDEDLTPWERATETLKPSGTKDPVFSDCKGDLLFSWHFLHTMHEFIELSTFPFRDFEDVLIWERDYPDESPSLLLSEAFTAITRCLFRNATGRLCSVVRYNVGGYKYISRSNWEQSVRGYVKSCIQVLGEIKTRDEDEIQPFEVPHVLSLYVSKTASLEETSYKLLSIPSKAKLLMFLCEQVGMLGKFKVFVDQFTGQLHDARSKLWEERAKVLEGSRTNGMVNGEDSESHTARKPTESLGVNGKSEDMDKNVRRLTVQVKASQHKVKSFCIEPLGQDRDFHTYWHLPTIGYRLYIESEDGWSYLDGKNEIEQLIGFLNEKGERESVLKERLLKVKDEMFSSIDSYFESFILSTEVRRSSRMASILKQKQKQSYVNSYLQ